MPLGRPGQPVELAPVYVLLASQEASFITGEIYGATGGNGVVRCRTPSTRAPWFKGVSPCSYTGRVNDQPKATYGAGAVRVGIYTRVV